MKRHLALLCVSLTLSAGGLALIVLARPGNASAPPANADKDAPPRIAASRITNVTVYPDSALVTREIDVPPGSGLMELVVNPLPEATVVSSLYTESTDNVRVLTTRFRQRPVKEDTREEVRKLEEEIKKIQQTARKIQAEAKTLEANVALLVKLENFAAANTTHATEKGKLDSDATIALAKYLMDGRNERAKQLLALQEQLLDNAERMDYAQRRMRHLSTGTSKIERDAVIVVDKVNAGAAKVKLVYLVSSASWRPQYKFRAGKTAKDPVVLEYLAAVQQQTGEDWTRVNITLSTAQPMLNAAPPELHTLAVAVMPRGAAPTGVTVSGLQTGLGLGAGGGGGRPGLGGMRGAGGTGPGGFGGYSPNAPMAQLPAGRLAIANPGEGAANSLMLQEAAKKLRDQAQVVANLRNEKDASELTNYAAVLDQVRDLVVAKGEGKDGRGRIGRRNEGPSVTYHLSTRMSVPSRPDEQVLEVAKIDMTPDYFYKAVPVLTPHIYRQADIVNNSRYVLLPGEATMYQGSDFVGRMTLPLVAIGERFTVGFGAEPQLQVQRVMLEKSRTMQAGNQILKYEYRILISSYKPERVKLQVWDRLPHAERDQLGVTLVRSSPEICKEPVYVREERSNNLLRWDLTIDPDMRGEKALKIQYEFQLELDRQATLGSFQTK